MNESPFASLLRGILTFAAVVALILLLAACATPVAPEPTRAAIPADLMLVCHDNWFHLYSESAQQALRLPIRCKEA